MLSEELQQRERLHRISEQEVQRLQGELDGVNAQLREERAQAEKARISLNTANARVSTLQARCEDSEHNLERAQQALAEEQKQWQAARDADRAAYLALETQLVETRALMQEQRAKFMVGEDATASIQEKLAQVRTELAQRTAELSVCKCDLDQKSKVISELEQQLAVTADARSVATSLSRREGERIRSLEDEIAALKRDLERAKGVAEKAEQHGADTQQRQMSQFETQRASFQEDIARLGEQLGKAQASLAMAESQGRRQGDEIARLRQALESGKQEMVRSVEEKVYIEGELKRLKEINQTAQAAATSSGKMIAELRQRADELEVKESSLRKEVSAQVGIIGDLRGALQQAQNQLDIRGREIEKLQSANKDMQAAMQESQLKTHTLDDRLQGEQKQRAILESGLGTVTDQRGAAEKLLSDLAAENAAMREQVRALESASAEAEGRAAECKRLWEAEVTSRSKLGARTLELERSLTDAQAIAERERKRAAKALEKKRLAEENEDAAAKRIAELNKENETLLSLARKAKQKLKDERSSHHALATRDKGAGYPHHVDNSTVMELRSQVQRLQDDLMREQTLRARAMQAASSASEGAENARLQQALATMAQQRAVEAEAARAAAEDELLRIRQDTVMARTAGGPGHFAGVDKDSSFLAPTRAPEPSIEAARKAQAQARHNLLMRELSEESNMGPPRSVTGGGASSPPISLHTPQFPSAGVIPSPVRGGDGIQRFREAWTADLRVARQLPIPRHRSLLQVGWR